MRENDIETDRHKAAV